jgi:hypothetical protein
MARAEISPEKCTVRLEQVEAKLVFWKYLEMFSGSACDYWGKRFTGHIA